MTKGEFQKHIQYKFQDQKILELALTHSSFAKENNERLEFLGDAVLSMYFSLELYLQNPSSQEGSLSQKRASFVNEASLFQVAKKIRLPEMICFGQSEAKDGREKASIVSSAFEALVGAIYLDSKSSKKTFQWLESLMSKFTFESENYKGLLQEYCQQEYSHLPEYECVKEQGPDHEKEYEVLLRLPDGKSFSSWGKSKRDAEKESAKKAWLALQKDLA